MVSCAAALVVVAALATPATSSATFTATNFGTSGAEPAVTNTPTDSVFFNWSANADNSRYCITVYRPSPGLDRGCLPSSSSYYALGQSNQFSQTENNLADGTQLGVYVSEVLQTTGIYPCSGDHCRTFTLIDLNQPQLTVYASGTATYTNNPQVPIHIDYFDQLSHPWFAGGDNAAVYLCARRDRACTNADPHGYNPNCSHVNASRFSSPGTNKTNSFDCTADYSGQADGPIYICATAADQSVPDPDPTANESLAIFPTHQDQGINPATGSGWTSDNANLADSTCGSVILDRGAPTISAHASSTNPGTGDLVTFSASGSDGMSGIAGPYTWDFGDNTPNKQGANITHTYTSPGTYHVVLTGHDGAGNEGSDSVDIVVKTVGGTGGEGTVVNNPPNNNIVGGGEGVQKTTLGSLKVVAPKKYKLRKSHPPIQLALIASKPGAFQAALTKGPKVLSKGAGVLGKAGTFGFKLKVPKRGVGPGLYKLRVTYVPDGATAGTTKTIPVRFFRPSGRVARQAVAGPAGPVSVQGPVNVEGGPPLAPGYIG